MNRTSPVLLALLGLLVFASQAPAGEVPRPASADFGSGGWIDPNSLECHGTKCRSYVGPGTRRDDWFTLEFEEICDYFGGDCRSLVRWVDEAAWRAPETQPKPDRADEPAPPPPGNSAEARAPPPSPKPESPPPAGPNGTPAPAGAPETAATAPSEPAIGPARVSPESPKPTAAGGPAPGQTPPVAQGTRSPAALLREAFEQGLSRPAREPGRLKGGLEIRPDVHGTGTADQSGETGVTGAFLEWRDRAERLLGDPGTRPEELAAALGELSRLAEQGLGEAAGPIQESIRRMVGEMAAALEEASEPGALAMAAGTLDWLSADGAAGAPGAGIRAGVRTLPAPYGEGALPETGATA